MGNRAAFVVVESLESRTLLSAEVISVGDHVLQPNKAGQTFQILISGDQQISGLDVVAQVADGGPAAGGQISGPTITKVDILNGTVFSGNNVGPEGVGSQSPQVYGELFTITAHDTVLGNGVLATVTVDTTGFSSGAWDFKLAGTNLGDSDLAGFPVSINNGHISIAGSPASGTGIISGSVFNDLDSNGRRGRGEGAAGTWEVFADTNNNGVLDDGEAFAMTDAAGNYSITGLAAGTYTLREVPQDGWRQTFPLNNGGQRITLRNKQHLAKKLIGVTQNALITGIVFTDSNANGVQDAGERPLPGSRVFLDLNDDGIWQKNEPVAKADRAGVYRISAPEGTYHVRQIQKGRLHVTTPASGFYAVTAGAGQTVDGNNFGNQ